MMSSKMLFVALPVQEIFALQVRADQVRADEDDWKEVIRSFQLKIRCQFKKQ